MKFDHKIALITGGSRGLGKNSALRLAKYGADVIIPQIWFQVSARPGATIHI